MLFIIIKIILTVVEVAVSVLLVTAILIQKSKTSGAGLAFGSGMGETLFGGQVGNVMTRITVVLAVIFLLNTTVLTFMSVKAKYRRPVPAVSTSSQPVQGPVEGGVEQGAGLVPALPDMAAELPSVTPELPVDGGTVPVSPVQ